MFNNVLTLLQDYFWKIIVSFIIVLVGFGIGLFAKKISMKFKIKMPFEVSSSFCKKCKKFIPPGIASKIRLDSKPKSIRITCSYCNHTYRKIISQ